MVDPHAKNTEAVLSEDGPHQDKGRLAQELASVEDYNMLDLKYDSNREGSFTKEGYEKLQRIIQKQDAKSKEIQNFINESKQAMNSLNKQLQNARQAYKKLEKDITGDANLTIKIDNQLFKRHKEKGEKQQNLNSGRKY
ncbi:hypothetical protein COL922a_009636 [Colletotrichum nupharicola]|nr:hypothetical protein COL922a_009636 [Colletotrichum nupharicola]